MTGLGALAQALGNASEAVADANRTVYQIDSENEAKNLIAQIGTQTQAFHQGLYTDPDAGVPQTPGAPTEANGYMKKWADFDANVQKQIDDSIQTSGSYFAYGRIGILIVSPKKRRVFYVYNG